MQMTQAAFSLHASPQPRADKIDQVARQLEGQFAQLLIKSMRDASFGDALFPQENKLFHDMYDQQLVTALTQGKGLGIAAMVARQLKGEDASSHSQTVPVTQDIARISTPTNKAAHVPTTPQASHAHSAEGFVANIWHHAQNAARELGVNVRALIAQAALETGWGEHDIRHHTGASTHNLFGIKANGWQGQRAMTNTHEYRHGVRHNERAAFRAYSSVADSFADYVKLLKQNPRYQQALRAGNNIHGFASALQKAGYATDPHYAEKISAIANGTTLKQIVAKMSGR